MSVIDVIYDVIVDLADLPTNGELSTNELNVTPPYGEFANYITGDLLLSPSAPIVPITFIHYPIDVFTEQALSFYGDFYERIHVTFYFFDLRSVTEDRSDAWSIWNAYSESKTLTAVNSLSIDDVTLSGLEPLPTTFQATEYRVYSYDTLGSGISIIDANFIFTWSTPVDNFSVLFIGSRETIIEAPWVGEVTETLEWLTGSTLSYDGTREQRARLRVAPRRSFSFSSLIQNDRKSEFYSKLSGRGNVPYLLPIWTEASRGAVNSGATRIYLDTFGKSYRVGGFVVLWNHATYESATVSNVTSTYIDVEKPVYSTYQSCWVVPAELATTPNQTMSYSVVNGTHDRAQLYMMLINAIDRPDTVADTIYNDVEVFTDELWLDSDTSEVGVGWKTQLIDGDSGTLEFLKPWNFGKASRSVRYVAQGYEDVERLKDWIYRRKGKCRVFWQPSFTNDLMLLPGTTSIASEITCVDKQLTISSWKKTELAIQLNDGTWLFRHIQSTSRVAKYSETFVLDSPVNLSVSSINRICFMTLRRFAADRIEIQWQPNYTAVCSVQTIEVFT